jgi:hypothetical protein
MPILFFLLSLVLPDRAQVVIYYTHGKHANHYTTDAVSRSIEYHKTLNILKVDEVAQNQDNMSEKVTYLLC